MTFADTPRFPTRPGYMTDTVQRAYIARAIAENRLPAEAHRMADIVSLTAPTDRSQPIQFWQLFSVLGQDPIVGIVHDFYQRVFADEDWFRSVFERVGGVHHHVSTQASMWIDVMGGGPYYHGADYRLNFHHYHNAIQLMDDTGAQRWSTLMRDTLDAATNILPDDGRVRRSINTFLDYFMAKYADDFSFENQYFFGEVNLPYEQKINFMKMSTAAIEALSDAELGRALAARGVDISKYEGKEAKVAKALML